MTNGRKNMKSCNKASCGIAPWLLVDEDVTIEEARKDCAQEVNVDKRGICIMDVMRGLGARREK